MATRTIRSLAVFLDVAVLLCGAIRADNLPRPSSSTTEIIDLIRTANGKPVTGTISISWSSFVTDKGTSVSGGHVSVPIELGGGVRLRLVANSRSQALASYYTAIYRLDDGTVSREYWVVPVSATSVTIDAIKSMVPPMGEADRAPMRVPTEVNSEAGASPFATASTYVLKAGDTMTGPLLLPADPVSSQQAADKHYVDTSVAAVGGGTGGKLALAPTASQVVAQPTGTSLSVNRLNGVEYASQYTTVGAANGIANATTSSDCASGCEVKADSSYATTEALNPTQWNSQTHVEDTRKGGRRDTYLNPESIETPGTESGQAIDVVSTRSGAALHQLSGSNQPASIGLAISNEAPVGGSNLFPQSIDTSVPYFKSGYSAMTVGGTYNTQGQHVLVPRSTNCYGVGDCLIGSEYLTSSGGFRDEADEGTHPMDIQISEDTKVFDGTCAAGCATGSTAVTITPTSGAGTQGDGRFLINMNPAKVLSTGSLISGTLGTPHASATFTATSFPLSTFFATGQVIPSQTTDVAPGLVTFLIATTGTPSGYATNTASAPATTGLACVADEVNSTLPSNYEMATYTVVDATHLQMTLKKAHATLATVAIGGLCGYGLEQKVDTANGIRQVFPVVGSYSATGLYYAGSTSAVVGQQGTTSAFANVNLPLTSLARTGNLVTLTTSTAMPFDLNGLTVTIAGAADSSYNGTFTGTSTAANTLIYTQTGANSSTTGGTLTLQTGSFALYPMAEVLSVFDAAAKSVDGQMTLAPNNVAWSVGDAVEEPHFFQQIVDTDISYVTQTMPRPTTYARAGINYQGNNGPGLQGWSINNTTPAANYVGNGGTHTAPDFAYQAAGVWKRSMVLQAGEQSAFTLNCNSHGCGKWNSPYNLFELQSSTGTDTIQYQPNTSTLTFSLRGMSYSFSPSGFSGGVIDATTLNGAISASNITSGTIAAARLPIFGPSGTAHAAGAVPDPGPIATAERYLREDGQWFVPSGGLSILPEQVNVLADYQLNDNKGTAPVDSSGNGNTGSFPGGTLNPVWTSQGLTCNGALSSTTGQYFSTARTQSAKTIMMVYTIANPMSSAVPSLPYFDTLWSTPTLTGLAFSSANQTYGYQPGLMQNGSQISTSEGSITGTHVSTVVLGTGTGNYDTYYLDGQNISYGSLTASFGKANAAYDVCGAPTGYSTYMNGNVYRWTAWSTQLTPQEVSAAAGLTKTLAQTKGVVFNPIYSPTTTPQAVFTGDSLTNGEGVTPFENFLSTNITYTVANYGIGNITAQQNMSLLPTREKPSYAPNAKSNISFIWNGTNDIATHGRTAQQAVDAVLQECQLMHSFGFKTIVATTISRANSGTSIDATVKNPTNLLLRQQALSACDVLSDFAGNPLVGADGAYASTTYYQSDTTHLSQVGQQTVIAPMASHSIDQATGSSPANCDPNVVTASTYTSVAADGCKVFNTAGNAITDTLPSAIGYTNRIIRRCNNSLSGTNALTIAAPSDTPFNNIAGTTTITVPNNACKDFKGTLISPTIAGEYWLQLN